MEALKLKQEEAEVLQFPTTKRIEVASFVNERNELLKRNRKAQVYSKSCTYRRKRKIKEQVEETISAILLFIMVSFFWLQLFI